MLCVELLVWSASVKGVDVKSRDNAIAALSEAWRSPDFTSNPSRSFRGYHGPTATLSRVHVTKLEDARHQEMDK